MERLREKKTGDVITFEKFEEGNILTQTRNDAESGDSSLESIFSISCSLIKIDSLSDSSPLYASLRVSVNVFPSSNCANVIKSPVCSFKEVAYGVYITARRIAIASE